MFLMVFFFASTREKATLRACPLLPFLKKWGWLCGIAVWHCIPQAFHPRALAPIHSLPPPPPRYTTGPNLDLAGLTPKSLHHPGSVVFIHVVLLIKLEVLEEFSFKNINILLLEKCCCSQKLYGAEPVFN